MLRTVVKIDKDVCNGCGLCVSACHEGAIGLVDGKAHLLRDDYCDGMGDCLPACPCNAISFEEREAAAYDEAAVAANMAAKAAAATAQAPAMPAVFSSMAPVSQLAQWPCQIKLVPVQAPYFAGADLLIAADCTAFACADFHQRFMAGRVTLVGCPKLDAVDYAEKLLAIFRANDIRNVLLARMEVPCCGGLQMAIKRAIAASGKDIAFSVMTLDRTGRVVG